MIGAATCGIAAGALDTKKAFEDILAERKLDARIVSVGCIGHCYAEPIVIVKKPDSPHRVYQKVTPGIARMIVKYHLEKGQPLFDHILDLPDSHPSLSDHQRSLPVKMQHRLVLGLCGHIDPGNINDYITRGGYAGLVKALQLQPEDIIQNISEAGLISRSLFSRDPVLLSAVASPAEKSSRSFRSAALPEAAFLLNIWMCPSNSTHSKLPGP